MSERRYVADIEFRVEGEGDAAGGVKIFGRAVPWMSLSVPLWRDYRTGKVVRERFAKGAFTDILAKPDVDIVALRDHVSTRLLGRTLSRTLRVYESDAGLDYDFDPPDTSDGRDVVVLVRRGDLRGSSFAFGVMPDALHEEWEETPDAIIRTVKKAALLEDVSPVTYPAYPQSSVDARSIEQAKEALETWRKGPAVDDDWLHEHRQGMARLAELGL